MRSAYLNRLSEKERKDLQNDLAKIQGGNCFICGKELDLDVQDLHIDHVTPLKLNGEDGRSNFALVHSRCNESKQDSNLRVARVLKRFEEINESAKQRSANLSDVLFAYGGSKNELNLEIIENGNKVKYAFSNGNDISVFTEKLYQDEKSQFKYFFSLFPIQYLFHDDKINPRSIGKNISKLVKEFYLGYPQLHISLAWANIENSKSKLNIFDGQHKAAAQILLGVKSLPVRVFLISDELQKDKLITANTHAGTNLRQVEFDKSVQSHLGNTLFIERVKRYKDQLNLSENDYEFSEQDLVNHFKGESKDIKKFILDSIRDSITYNEENRLINFVDFGGRANEKPLSYSTISKTFYSFFIGQELLNTPLDYLFEEGENPRELEKEQLLNLMNIIADEIFIGKFDPTIGTSKIEYKIQKGEDVPEEHLIAFRMAKEEIIYNWLRHIRQIIILYFFMQRKMVPEKKLLQCRFPDTLWETIKDFVRDLRSLPLWVNRDLSATVFGGKQNYDYWQTIFSTGRTPQGLEVLPEPLSIGRIEGK